MDFQFYGANCISISNKNVRLVVDDNLADLDAKSVTKEGDIALFTGPHSIPSLPVRIVIDHAGEYEVSEVSVYGIPLRGHMDEAGKKDVTAYKIIAEDIRILVTGHIYPDLSERELEAIGTIDIMFVPVGGNGYTADPVGAMKLVKKVEPKMVIPTHFHDDAIAYPVPQQTLEQMLSAWSIEPSVTTDKLKVKASDFGEGTQLVLLNRA